LSNDNRCRQLCLVVGVHHENPLVQSLLLDNLCEWLNNEGLKDGVENNLIIL
jgi:hypothetical protein